MLKPLWATVRESCHVVFDGQLLETANAMYH